jgi:GrpB-like predicted nucleotidyltransferase (UPF0157 family)
VTAETPDADPAPADDGFARAANDAFAASVASGEVVLFGEPTGEPVVLESWNPAWATEFEGLRSGLAIALGQVAVRIDHIGSTAVTGLDAKPTIDIQIGVPDVQAEDAFRPAIESLGFPMRSREPGHCYFRTPKGAARRVQIHVCTVGSDWEREHLLFRDYLRAQPETARRYAALKRELAIRYAGDRIAYTEAKSPFIRGVVADAERWAEATGWQP